MNIVIYLQAKVIYFLDQGGYALPLCPNDLLTAASSPSKQSLW